MQMTTTDNIQLLAITRNVNNSNNNNPMLLVRMTTRVVPVMMRDRIMKVTTFMKREFVY